MHHIMKNVRLIERYSRQGQRISRDYLKKSTVYSLVIDFVSEISPQWISKQAQPITS